MQAADPTEDRPEGQAPVGRLVGVDWSFGREQGVARNGSTSSIVATCPALRAVSGERILSVEPA